MFGSHQNIFELRNFFLFWARMVIFLGLRNNLCHWWETLEPSPCNYPFRTWPNSTNCELDMPLADIFSIDSAVWDPAIHVYSQVKPATHHSKDNSHAFPFTSTFLDNHITLSVLMIHPSSIPKASKDETPLYPVWSDI